MKKKTVREQREKKLFDALSNLGRKGYNYNEILKDKPLESFTTTDKIFKRTMQRIKEMPSIKRTEEKRKEKFKKKLLKNEIKRVEKNVKKQIKQANFSKPIMDKVKQYQEKFPQFQPFILAKDLDELNAMEMKLKQSPQLKDLVPQVVESEARNFFEKYFTQLGHDMGIEEQIDEMVTSFGADYDKLKDFIEHVTHPSFTGEYDSDQMSDRDPEGYHAEMQNRIVKMTQFMRTNLKYDTKDTKYIQALKEKQKRGR